MNRIARLVLAVLGVTLAPAAVHATAVVSNVGFAQGSWYTTAGGPALLNSTFGRFDFDATPDPLTTSYLNLVGTYGANSAWMVRNLPLFDATVSPGTVRFAADLDYADLGLADGTPLSSLGYRYTVTPAPLAVAPGGADTTATVETADYTLRRDDEVGPEGKPAVPAPHKAAGLAFNEYLHEGVPRVKEDPSQCMPGSFARSIGWLNQKYGLGSTKTAQQFYDDLKALMGCGVLDGDGNRLTRETRIKRKADYLSGITNKAITKVRDLVGLVGPIAGVPEDSSTNLLTWLKSELKTEDVELAVQYSGGGRHIVTLVGLFKQGDDWYTLYRDDWYQKGQGADAGDRGIKIAKLGSTDGAWWFGDASTTVTFCISESVPEPAAAMSVGLFTVLTLRRRTYSRACPVV